jgi:hypothetical protein
MGLGSTYALVKGALVDRLSERPGLADVAITAAVPESPLAVRGDTGSGKAIWVADAEGDLDNVVFGAPDLYLEETYNLTVVVQAIWLDTDDTQLSTDQRVDEMLYEVLHELAQDTALGIDTAALDLPYLQVTRGPFRRFAGPLTNTNRYPSRAELDLSVEARLRIPGT